jgi:hypothetical protein
VKSQLNLDALASVLPCPAGEPSRIAPASCCLGALRIKPSSARQGRALRRHRSGQISVAAAPGLGVGFVAFTRMLTTRALALPES